jgi:hypothetical protein
MIEAGRPSGNASPRTGRRTGCVAVAVAVWGRREGTVVVDEDDPSIAQTYRGLRVGMVVLVLLLFGSVVFEIVRTGVAGQLCLQPSISAYYYTPARPVFVAALSAVGAGLIGPPRAFRIATIRVVRPLAVDSGTRCRPRVGYGSPAPSEVGWYYSGIRCSGPHPCERVPSSGRRCG